MSDRTDPTLSIRVEQDEGFDLPPAIAEALAEVGEAVLQAASGNDEVEGFNMDGLKMGTLMPTFNKQSSGMFGDVGLNLTCTGTYSFDPKTGSETCKTTFSS